MGLFTKSLLILIIAASAPFILRQFVTKDTSRTVSLYLKDYKTVNQVVQWTLARFEQAISYLPDSIQFYQIASKLPINVDLVSIVLDQLKGTARKTLKTTPKELVRFVNCPGDQHGKLRLINKTELAEYDGTIEDADILVGFLGLAYNVSFGYRHYGKGADYNVFAGTDATRAFITGNFTHDLNDDVSDLDAKLLPQLASWLRFYEDTYEVVARIEGSFYDSRGCPTESLHKLEASFKTTRTDQQEQEEKVKQYPECNSEWNSELQTGKTWCTNKSGGIGRDWVGFPRIYNDGDFKRCACVREEDLENPAFEIYPGCDAKAIECPIS